jgi:hypothetical protein
VTSTVWKAILTFAKAFVACAPALLTYDFISCGKAAFELIFTNLWNVPATLIHTALTASGLKFIANGVNTFLTHLIGKESDALRQEAMGLLSLDWTVFMNALPLLLPNMLIRMMDFLPIPAFLVSPLKNGVQFVTSISNYHKFFTYYLSLLWDILTTLWYCFRGSGECCYPSVLKEKYKAAKEREAKGVDIGVGQRLSNAFGTLGRQFTSLFSDERVKRHLFSTGLILDGLEVHMYVLRPDFLSQLQLEKSKTLPKWIREMQAHPRFWREQVFYGVSAQEVEKIHPEAVCSYCFTQKKMKRSKHLPRCTKYILYSKLPHKLRRTLDQMNYDLYENRVPPYLSQKEPGIRRATVVG